MEKRFMVCDWLSGDVIAAFWTENERDEWIRDNCEQFSDGIYLEGIGKVYRQN